MDEPQDNSPKKEKDSRRDAFLREAQAILVSQKNWSDETRLKLRVLADRLKLPTPVFEAAMEELLSAQDTNSKTRWEEAYVVYLEKQFAKIPGDILTLRSEKKAIEYGQRRFELSVDACDRLIEQVAERMDMVRISETEALRHAKSEVIRLASGHYEEDNELVDQVITAVSRWGVSEERATQLLRLQIATNRSKRRSRRLQTLTIRVSLLFLGLASIAATIFLGQIIARMESGEETVKKEKEESKLATTEIRTQTKPSWWTVGCLKYQGELLELPEWKSIAESLSSEQPKVRAQAYDDFLNRLSDLSRQATTVDTLNLENVDLQDFLIDVFCREPESQNAYRIARGLTENARLVWGDTNDETRLVNNDLRAFLTLGKLERILIRMANAALEQPDRSSELLTVLNNANSDFPSSPIGNTDRTKVLAETWKLRRVEELNHRLWSHWPITSADEAELDSTLVESVLNSIGDETPACVAGKLKLKCVLAAVSPGYAKSQWNQICDEIAGAPKEQRRPGLYLLMAVGDEELRKQLLMNLRNGLDETLPFSELNGLEVVVRTASDLDLRLDADDFQRRARAFVIHKRINDIIGSAENKTAELIRLNTLAIALIEARWDFIVFDKVLLDERMELAGTDDVKTVAESTIAKVVEAKESLELIDALEILQDQLQQAGLTYQQSMRLISVYLATNEESLQQAWQDIMPQLCGQPMFLIAISDLCEKSLESEKLISQRMQRWSELQLGIKDWNHKTTRELAFKRLSEKQNSAAQWMREILDQHLGSRLQALNGTSSGETPLILTEKYQRLFAALFDTNAQLPEGMDDRFENVLHLHRLMLAGFASRYAVDKVAPATIELPNLARDDTAMTYAALMDVERELAKELLDRLSDFFAQVKTVNEESP